MLWAFENERTHALLHEVLLSLPLEDRAVVQGALALATDDRGRAVDAGVDTSAKSSVTPQGVLWFDSAALMAAPAAYQRAVLAHELAHLYLGHHRMSLKTLSWEAGEYAADVQAVKWGYRSIVSLESLTARPFAGTGQNFGEVSF